MNIDIDTIMTLININHISTQKSLHKTCSESIYNYLNVKMYKTYNKTGFFFMMDSNFLQVGVSEAHPPQTYKPCFIRAMLLQTNENIWWWYFCLQCTYPL